MLGSCFLLLAHDRRHRCLAAAATQAGTAATGGEDQAPPRCNSKRVGTGDSWDALLTDTAQFSDVSMFVVGARAQLWRLFLGSRAPVRSCAVAALL